MRVDEYLALYPDEAGMYNCDESPLRISQREVDVLDTTITKLTEAGFEYQRHVTAFSVGVRAKIRDNLWVSICCADSICGRYGSYNQDIVCEVMYQPNTQFTHPLDAYCDESGIQRHIDFDTLISHMSELRDL